MFYDAEALQEQINLQLLSDLMNYIISVSDNSDARTVMREWVKTSIYPLTLEEDKINFLKSYELLYLGEFLVYYKEKGYTELKDFRAIALALAHTKEYLNASFFNEKQLDDFLKSLAVHLDKQFDIYLAVALYKLTTNVQTKDILLYAIRDNKYDNVVDCVFSVMLYDDLKSTADLLTVMFDKICGVLTNVIGFSIVTNGYIYGFLINTFKQCLTLKKYRDGSILRVLSKLAECRISENTDHYKKLIKFGYTDEEIKYLNYKVPFYFGLLDTNSLAFEKIIIDYCKLCIGRATGMSEVEKNDISNLFESYRNFSKKFNGYENLLEVICSEVTIVSNDSYIWLFKHLKSQNKLSSFINYSIFLFPTDDSKFKERFSIMTVQQEIFIFSNYILGNYDTLKNNHNEIKNMIDCFHEFTNIDLVALYCNKLDSESLFKEDEDNVFIFLSGKLLLLLVEAQIISLENYINAIKNDALLLQFKNILFDLIKLDIANNGLLFLENFNKEIGIKNFKVVFKHSLLEVFRDNSTYNYYDYVSKKYGSVLKNIIENVKYSKVQKQTIFLLLFEYCYYVSDEDCITLLNAFLLANGNTTILKKKQLEAFFRSEVKLGVSLFKDTMENLQKNFLSDKELKEKQQEEEEKWKNEVIEKDNIVLEQLKNDMSSTEDKITFLYYVLFPKSYSYIYRMSDDTKKYQFIAKTLQNLINGIEDIAYLIQNYSKIIAIRQNLYEVGFLSLEDFLYSNEELTSLLKQEEVLINAN